MADQNQNNLLVPPILSTASYMPQTPQAPAPQAPQAPAYRAPTPSYSAPSPTYSQPYFPDYQPSGVTPFSNYQPSGIIPGETYTSPLPERY